MSPREDTYERIAAGLSPDCGVLLTLLPYMLEGSHFLEIDSSSNTIKLVDTRPTAQRYRSAIVIISHLPFPLSV